MADTADTTTTATTEQPTAPAADAVDETAVETTILGDAGEEKPADTGKTEGEEKPEDKPKDRPIAPEKYELTAPEGFTLDTEALTQAEPVFRELNLTNDQAQKLVPVAADFAKRIQQQGQQAILTEVQAQRKAWAEEAQKDSEIGGSKWDETVHLSAKALDALGYTKGSPFRSFLTDSGLGNHPEMIRAMRRIGERVGEDGDFVRPDAAAQAKPTREQLLYPEMTAKEQ